jgi:hypothetical protein
VTEVLTEAEAREEAEAKATIRSGDIKIEVL